MNLKPAYQEGQIAARAGEGISVNPYNGAHRGRKGMRRAAWNRGFRATKKEESK